MTNRYSCVFVLCFLAVISVSACDLDSCTTSYEYGLEVTVTDAEDGTEAHADAGGAASAPNCIQWEARIDWTSGSDGATLTPPSGWEPIGGDAVGVVSRRCTEYEE